MASPIKRKMLFRYGMQTIRMDSCTQIEIDPRAAQIKYLLSEFVRRISNLWERPWFLTTRQSNVMNREILLSNELKFAEFLSKRTATAALLNSDWGDIFAVL